MTFEATATVQNTPIYALKRKYWIVTPVHGELWFYSAFDTFETAKQARQDDQIIVENLGANNER